MLLYKTWQVVIWVLKIHYIESYQFAFGLQNSGNISHGVLYG